MKVNISLNIDFDKWEFLKPLLEPYVVKPEQAKNNSELINFDEISKLKNGIRIINVLRNGYWSQEYTYVGVDRISGKPAYCVKTIGDLKKVTMPEFLKNRNAGQKSWEELEQYIKSLELR